MQFAITQWEHGYLTAIYSQHGLQSVRLHTDLLPLTQELRTHFKEALPAPKTSIAHRQIQQIVSMTRDPNQSYEGAIDLRGTTFQQSVWQFISQIPWGETKTYSQLASTMHRPKAYRAVANACGANPLPIIFPCHRVTGKQHIGGYRWGIELKLSLLRQERGNNNII